VRRFPASVCLPFCFFLEEPSHTATVPILTVVVSQMEALEDLQQENHKLAMYFRNLSRQQAAKRPSRLEALLISSQVWAVNPASSLLLVCPAASAVLRSREQFGANEFAGPISLLFQSPYRTTGTQPDLLPLCLCIVGV
jgi:hypothetical protein